MYRSPEIGVAVVQNKRGWFINIRLNMNPLATLGPYDYQITLTKAMQLAAVEIKLNHLGEEDNG